MKGMFALLSADDSVGTGSENDLEAAQTATEVAQGETDVNEAIAKVETDVTAADQAIDASDELEAIGNVAADAVESGEGLDEKAAEIATIAVESIYARLSIRTEQNIVLARESFGHTNTRLSSTKVIVEGVSDSLKKIWAGIKAFAKRIWDKIVGFFNKLFGTAKSLNKHLEDLKDRARKLEGKPKDKKLKGGVAAKISVAGKASEATYKALVDNGIGLFSFGQKLCEHTDKVNAGLKSLSTKALGGNGLTESDLTDFVKSSVRPASAADGVFGAVSMAGMGTDTKNAKKTKGTKAGGSTTVNAYGPFVGSKFLKEVETIYADGDSDTQYSFNAFPDKQVADEAEALEVNGILTVIKLAQSAADKIEDFAKVKDALGKTQGTIDKLSDDIIKGASKLVEGSNANSATRKALKVFQNETRDSISLTNFLGQQAPAVLYSTALAGADYASASIANIK